MFITFCENEKNLHQDESLGEEAHALEVGFAPIAYPSPVKKKAIIFATNEERESTTKEQWFFFLCQDSL